MSAVLRRVMLAITLSFVVSAIPFVNAGSQSVGRAALDVVKVRTLPHLGYSSLHVAEAEGFFAREGLRVEFVEIDVTVPDVPPLMQGQLDVLPTVVGPGFLNAAGRGGRVRLVAAQHELGPWECAYMAVVASRQLASSGALVNPGDLKGRRIAVSRSFVTIYLLDRLLATVGLERSDLIEVEVVDSIRGEALDAGRIDLAVLTEPWLTRAVEGGYGVVWKRFDDVAPGLPYTAIVYGPTLLDARPDVGRRFMTAYLRAVRQMNRGKTARNVDILSAATGLERRLIERACWPSVPDDGAIDGASVLAFQSWAREHGLVDRVMPMSELADDRFRAQAMGVLSSEAPR